MSFRNRFISLSAFAALACFACRADAQVFNPNAYASLGGLNIASGSVVFDTDALTRDGLSGGVLTDGVAVFDYDAISFGVSVSVSVTGSRPLALLSRSDFALGAGARISVSPGLFNASPGSGGYAGGAGATLDSPFGKSGSGAGAGSGGGAFGGLGGSGVYGGSNVAGSGAVYGDLSVKLEGGSGGAGGNGSRNRTTGAFVNGGNGGGGGGALEISANGVITVAGTLDATGGSGQPGGGSFGLTGYPGGGGAGGGIVLAGQSVTVASTGQVWAYGGSSGDFGAALFSGGGGRLYIKTRTAADYGNQGSVSVGPIYSSGQAGIITLVTTPGSISGTVALDSLSPNAAPQTVTFTFRDTTLTPLFLRTVSIGADGAFSLPNIPAGSYNLRVTAAKYLAQSANALVTAGQDAKVGISLPGGDADGNNTVDILDFGFLVNAYGSDVRVSGSGYDANADFNFDGTVDVLDFGILVNNYGAVGDK